MNAGSETYAQIVSDPFDGTVMPIAYVPDWTKVENQDKSKRFENIAISEYLPIPLYDALTLRDTTSETKSSTILHYTYITPYMGSYRLNYKENDGSHNGVDIRAPIGTPVLAIANGVVVWTKEADATGNKYIVIRHDGIPTDGGKITLYSGYLHLSEILVQAGTKIKKWEMIGRVGMTGIATTPHLHLQIDTADAPFHPYWPFTSSESRSAGLGFYDSVNTWLGKEKALKYSIHPMNFINMYLWGINSGIPYSVHTEVAPSDTNRWTPQTIIASSISESSEECTKKRFSDVNVTSSVGKMLYPLVDKKCLFQENTWTFGSKSPVTKKEAIREVMKYAGISPVSWVSQFLDIAIGDSFQGYALAATRYWVLEGNYAEGDRILTKWEFITLLTKIIKAEKNPSQIRIYRDVDPMNPNYQSIQNYGYKLQVRSGKFYPDTILTRWMLVQILSGLDQKK
jgi:hypothetical protein